MVTQIYNIKKKPKFIKEVAILTQKEWGDKEISEKEFEIKVKNKIKSIKAKLDNPNYCKLILVKDNKLIGFISIFEHDGEERNEFTPWYATMYVKKEYRGNGYSRILNNAILAEARKRNITKLYLKTDLDNYYEKLGAQKIGTLSNGEKSVLSISCP